MKPPTPGEVRDQLARIVASPGFANAERMRRFLTFTVEAALRGEQNQIKEFTIGREVFDRDGEYDPRIDPIVRVEARRLRTRLEEYYASAGSGDPVRIDLPKGSYVPAIRGSVTAGSGSQLRLLTLAGVVAAVIGFVVWYAASPPPPTLAVIPASWIYRDAADLLPDEALAEQVTAELANHHKIPVIAWPLVLQQKGIRRDTKEVARTLNVRRVLILSVARNEGGATRITSFLIEPSTGIKQLVREYYPDPAKPGNARELASAIAAGIEAPPLQQ